MSSRWTRLSLTILAWTLIGAAPASDLTYTPPTMPEGPDVGSLTLRLFGLTATLCGLVVLAAWYARRCQQPVAQVAPDGTPLELVETLHLTPRCALHLLKADQHSFLVGTDASGLRSLMQLTEPFEPFLDLPLATAPPSADLPENPPSVGAH